jgi:hypothetical protein
MKLLTALAACLLFACAPTRVNMPPSHLDLKMPANARGANFTDLGVWVIRVDDPTLNADGSVSPGSVVAEFHPFTSIDSVSSTVAVRQPQ